MTAKDHLSPEQLQDHVQQHLEHWPESYDTAKCANGNCHHASIGYIMGAKDAGHDASFRTYDVPDDVQVSHHPSHTVAQVQTSRGPYVVDLTHRQFDEKSPHPLIEPVEKFESRKAMRPFRHVTEYGLHEDPWE